MVDSNGGFENPHKKNAHSAGVEASDAGDRQRYRVPPGKNSHHEVSRSGTHSPPYPWAVVGAAAARLYMPEQLTAVLDILVSAADTAAAQRKLEDAGNRYRAEPSIGRRAWSAPDGFQVDVIEGAQPWCAQAITEARLSRDVHGAPT